MKYLYKVKVNRVKDGDTFEADVDLGFNACLKDCVFRLYGINAPETRVNKAKGITLEEVAKGKESAKIVESIMTTNQSVLINSIKDSKEKFGRYLAIVYIPVALWNWGPFSEDNTVIIDNVKYVNLNDYLVAQGYAKAADYD